jgi:DnaJ-class molecular chaperone
MSDDYEYDDEACPKCGHSPTHRRECGECDEGYVNRYEEDPMWYDDEDVPCDECNGTGWQRWCPKCGHSLQKDMK